MDKSRLKQAPQTWSLFSRTLHWLTALMVFALYALGWYMLELDYYDPWYRTGPFWHKSMGLLLAVIIILRVANRLLAKHPEHLPEHHLIERYAAALAHLGLYLLLMVAVASGFLISTADGSSVSFFDWFEVPALPELVEDQEELAGDIHIYATDVLIVLALVHAAGALKHHFIDKDATLVRMLKSKLK